MKDYMTGVSFIETEPSEIRLVPAPDSRWDLDTGLMPTWAPWRIAPVPGDPGRLTKIFAWGGSVSQYEYGTGWDTSEWAPSWQKGLVCSWEAGFLSLDRDAEGFEDMMRQCGIPPSGKQMLTGRPDGRQHFYDGRGLAYEDWPRQGSIYDAAGEQIGDVKSRGFVPAPGSIHPNGSLYLWAPGSEHGELTLFRPEYTRAIREWREAHPGLHRTAGGSYERDAGSYGRNDALYEFKKELFYRYGLDEDDPEMARRIFVRNRQFPVPLSEAEIRATILQPKGLKRRRSLGSMQGLEKPGQEGSLGEAERREHEARMAEAFGRTDGAQGVPAGQDSVCGIGGENLPSRKQLDDLLECTEPWSPCMPLTVPADLKAKWAAELDDHELSRDWDQRGGRRGQAAYGWVMQQLIAGTGVQREKIEDQIWECLSRKSANGAILLSEGDDGQVIAWSDPEPDPAEEPRDPWPGYPQLPRRPQSQGRRVHRP